MQRRMAVSFADCACRCGPMCRPLKLLGGVDLSFVGDDSEVALASLVVLSFPALELLHASYERVELKLPYISGTRGPRPSLQ